MSTEKKNKNVRKSVMMIVSNECPLDCVYCYETEKNAEHMTFETMKKIIDSEMEVDDRYEEIVFDMFGGEPFTNFEVIKKGYEYLHSKNWPKKYIVFTTTNGVLVHGEIQEWLNQRKEGFWCSLSVDGTPEMHDLNRNNSYKSIDVDFFQKNWPKQPVKMTISRETLPNLAEGIIYLHEKGFQVTSTFAQGIDWSDETFVSVLAQQLEQLIEFYKSHPEYEVSSVLNYEIEHIGYEGERTKKWCGCGDAMKSYATDGTLYPCQCFTPLTNQNKQQHFDPAVLEKEECLDDQYCISCNYKAICPTCYGVNYLTRGQFNLRDKSLCKLYKLCIDATAKMQTENLLSQIDESNVTSEQYYLLRGAQKIFAKIIAN